MIWHPTVVTLVFTLVFTFASAAAAVAATLFVGNDGLDGPGCGTKTAPCRSITAAIAAAAPGDKIVVGPGRYGDVDDDGTVGEVGEETPAPGCGCILAINKSVAIASSDGAGSTIVHARNVTLPTNVLVIADGAQFGEPGKGFDVTNTAANPGVGIIIDSNGVAIRGNRVVLLDDAKGFGRVGIDTVDFPQTVLIENNDVLEWGIGIRARAGGKTVRKNKLMGNRFGIDATGGLVVGNVAISNGDFADRGDGIRVTGPAQVTGNTVYGNAAGIHVRTGFTGVVEKNNVAGNAGCGISNEVAGLDATRNYWGSANGPGADPADDVCNEAVLGASATVTPFATKPYGTKLSLKE